MDGYVAGHAEIGQSGWGAFGRPHHPRGQSLAITARGGWGQRFSLGGELHHGFARRGVPAAAAKDDPSGIPTDAYTVLDLSA
ncbi:MAG TPA: hypothetical protein VFK39_15315 [Gemmatimonadaceae bacterium]|nr:hypothetical protein [Gemmatimonadaceae bacterium]